MAKLGFPEDGSRHKAMAIDVMQSARPKEAPCSSGKRPGKEI